MAIVQFVDSETGQDVAEEHAIVRRSLSRLETTVDTALGSPETLATDVQKLIGGVSGEGGVSVLGGLKALRRLVAIIKRTSTIATTTASRIQQVQNQGAIQALFAQTAMVEMANVARELEYESVDEALAVRDEVADLLETEAQTTEDDATFTALMQLRAGVSRDITTRAADLSRMQAEQAPIVTNTLLTSYRLYGRADRDQEIADRNNLPIPGFISPADPLQVLNG